MRIAQAVFYAVTTVVIAAAAAVAWAASYSEIEPVESAEPEQFSPETIARGAMLASMGNCITCHTVEDGQALAGGVPIPTPFGTIHSTNITPDSETGIGRWSETAFRRAMREGIDREGNYLYPAFPYDHYTKASDEDIGALYAYLMTRRPVAATAPENDLPFPLNLRLVVAGWNLLYLDEGPYEPDPTQNEAWNRGAYLVEGLGHCGSCHTPRNALGAEDEDRRFAGGFGEGWHGPALDGDSPAPVAWTAEQIATYLGHDWQEFHGTPLGPMAEVADNLQRMPQEDIAAIATYIASFMPPGDEADSEETVAAAAEKAWTPTQLASLDGAGASGVDEPGELIFAGACATCHYRGGETPATRPVAIGLSTTVAMDEPTNFLQVVVNGVHPRDGTAGAMMPAFGDILNDEQIADLAAYVRSHFTEKPAWDGVAAALDDVRQEPGDS